MLDRYEIHFVRFASDFLPGDTNWVTYYTSKGHAVYPGTFDLVDDDDDEGPDFGTEQDLAEIFRTQVHEGKNSSYTPTSIILRYALLLCRIAISSWLMS